jgi:hypothetical protein
MTILVKENSKLLPRIKIGYQADMKYYSSDYSCPFQVLKTEIRDISRQDYGRLKGHYVVGLEIMESKCRNHGNQMGYSKAYYEAEIHPFNYSL